MTYHAKICDGNHCNVESVKPKRRVTPITQGNGLALKKKKISSGFELREKSGFYFRVKQD